MKVDPGSELARLLEAVEGEGLLLEKDGQVFRINREGEGEDTWSSYDAERVRQALAKTSGSWADIDTEALIGEIYRTREEGSRPADRP